jgi:hypothetical protein
MRVGKPFQIRGVANSRDTFIPIRTACRNCKKKFTIYAMEPFALKLYGSRTLECMGCYDGWEDVMEALGSESRAPYMAVQRVTLTLEAL